MADKLGAGEIIERFVDSLDATWARLMRTWPKDGSIQQVTAGGLAPGQALKTFTGQVTLAAGVTTVALWTVANGKTGLITDVSITTNEGATMLEAQIQAAGTAIFRQLFRDLAPIQMPGIETQPQANQNQAVTLVLPADTGKLVSFTICAVEQ